ncbi:hypothetical protein [Lysinibacillus fusiformis]|uniref:hypothetical protein n=1 Tax=Lysinibacillus fusiformis TaxID=28031 RepID=UPI001967C8DC|nr:hypothetical protein [Lysinibacillus fusiformis]QSB09313.1 hypothetical protein JTI58_20255 [Lysinibacillus fusiformis]UXJ70920.1 hypothetical protein N5069_10390 [Lysinibacillus fusiformis]
MSADFWRLDNGNFALYIDTTHVREIRNIKRSRDWSIIATYQKNGRVVGLQWRVPESDYRAAKRIENRINKGVHEIEEKPSLDTG